MFQNQFNRHVRDTVAAGVIPVEMAIDGKDAEGAYAAILQRPDAVRTAYKYVYSDSVHTIWYVFVPITGVGLMFSLMARNESMDRGLNSKQAFEHRKKEPKDEEVMAVKS